MIPGQVADPVFVRELHTRGYAVVEDVLDAETVLDPVLDAAARQVSARAEEERIANRLDRSFAGADFRVQLMRLAEQGVSWIGRVLDVSLPGKVEATSPMFLDPAAFALLSCPTLLDRIAEVIGEEIWLSPVGHTRTKVPHHLLSGTGDGMIGEVPWHQDNGVLLPEADDVDVLTIWIPLVDVDENNGCLQVVASPWHSELLDHCPGGPGVHIPDRVLADRSPRPVPMRRGSVLIMHSRTVHSSMPNRTRDQVRVSLDLRYQGCAQPNGRPPFPSFLLRSAGAGPTDLPSPDEAASAITGEGGAPVTYEDWREGWLATRERLAERQVAFGRWDGSAPACA